MGDVIRFPVERCRPPDRLVLDELVVEAKEFLEAPSAGINAALAELARWEPPEFEP